MKTEALLELRRLSSLALPMMLTQVSQMGMGVADTMMAGRVSAADLAGIALGGNFFWPTLMLLTGIIMSLTPSVSQLHGAGREHEAGAVVRQALWIVLTGGGLLIVFLLNVEPLYEMIGVDPLAIPIAVSYLEAVSYGVLPLLGYFALRYLCDGMSWTTPAMLIAVSALVLKIPLNYLFIYGAFEFEGMGGIGCGWSSAIVMWYELIVMILVVCYSRIRVAGVFERFSGPDFSAMFKMIKLGLPIGLTIFLEFSMFSVVTLLIARLGVDVVAAHQIAGSVGGVTFMVPLALGMAVSIRVGFNVGANDFAAARLSGWVAICVSVVFALVAAIAVYFSRSYVAELYSNDLPVILVAVDLLLFVVLYQLFDDTQVTASGALRGFKDTRTPMWVAIVSYWFVGLPVGIALGFGWFELSALSAFEGVRGFWVGLLAGLAVAATILLFRYHWLSRQEARIMEFATR